MKKTIQDSKRRRFSKFSPIHPLIFAIVPIWLLFSNNVSELNIEEIIVPIVLSVGITGFVFFILSKFVLKNSLKAGVVVSTGVILFFFYGHIYTEISHLDIFGFDITRHTFLIPLFLSVFGIVFVKSIKSKSDFLNVSVIFNIVAITLLVIPAVNVTSFYIEQFPSNQFTTQTSENEINIGSMTITDSDLVLDELPDVYYIILDGYPDTKTLERVYDFDNSEFLSYLNEKGFFVPADSHSNYDKTVLSMTSSLNMAYLVDHAKYDSDESLNHDISLNVKQMLWNNEVMKVFAEKGYSTISFKSGYRTIDLISVAQNSECEGGKGPFTSRFMVMLTETSMLKFSHITKLYESNKKNDILCIFNSLPNVSAKYDEPVFVFAHILVPHPPYLFDKDGGELSPETLDLGNQRWDNTELFVGQLQFANGKLEKTIDSILKNSQDEGRESVIILQGDHGTQVGFDPNNITKEGVMNRMHILNTYYLPGIETPEEFIDKKITPVNTFRVISNIYLGQNYTLLDNRSYVYENEKIKFTDVTDIVSLHDLE